MKVWIFLSFWIYLAGSICVQAQWARHTIDNTSRGADGIRSADINSDGLPDFATGWEEGGVVRVYLHPGYEEVKEPWPQVTIGEVDSPEDAVLVDLDGDGRMDVISSHEGKERNVWVHWAPTEPDAYLHADQWVSQKVPALEGKQWMYCLPYPVPGREHPGLLFGAKNEGAELMWLTVPDSTRNLEEWHGRGIMNVGWIMSLILEDMNRDGILDIVFSDRRGDRRGCYLWEIHNHADSQSEIPGVSWKEHIISKAEHEYMFMTVADLDQDGVQDVFVATPRDGILLFQRNSVESSNWHKTVIPFPENIGTGKAVEVADLDLDGNLDIMLSCENAKGKRGVVWLKNDGTVQYQKWLVHDISGIEGTKYDRMEAHDFDGDGDLDIITCEEAENLGVIWYENPLYSE